LPTICHTATKSRSTLFVVHFACFGNGKISPKVWYCQMNF
jgi:hypothetical protein